MTSVFFRPAYLYRPAAAFVVAAVTILALGCGGGGDGRGSPGPDTSPGPVGSTSPPAAAIIDLQKESGVVQYRGQDPTDLVNVSTTVALGDFNDDGEPDALVGAPQADGPNNDREDAGEAYVILGPLDESRELGAGEADVTIFGAAAGDGLGFSVVSGDLNGDGVDDVIAGAPGVTAGFDPRSDQGRAYVFYGGEDMGDDPELDLREDVFDFTVTGAEGFGRLAHAMELGDVNGDGTADLVVGAPFAGRKAGTPPGGERTALGEVYVILGGSALTGEKNIARDEFDALLSGAFPFGQFGASLGVGDVNGDGVEDIVAGAYRAADTQGSTAGLAYVFFGREKFASRLLAQEGDADVVITGPAGSSFGFPLTTGDFNGDGVEDMAFGAQLETSGLLDRQGTVRVILGSEDLEGAIDAVEASAIVISGSTTGELFPSALTAADLDGDGAADLVAGSILASGDEERASSGMVLAFTNMEVLPGTVDLSEDAAPLSVLGAAADDRLGGAVAAGEPMKDTRGILAVAAMADGRDDGNDLGAVYVISFSQ